MSPSEINRRELLELGAAAAALVVVPVPGFGIQEAGAVETFGGSFDHRRSSGQWHLP